MALPDPDPFLNNNNHISVDARNEILAILAKEISG